MQYAAKEDELQCVFVDSGSIEIKPFFKAFKQMHLNKEGSIQYGQIKVLSNEL